MTMAFVKRGLTIATLTVLAFASWRHDLVAQAASPSHVVIPFLANATRPADLDFEGGECDLGAGGTQMDCTFQQVFLTTSSVAPDTCLITTNRYQRSFRREGQSRWVSSEGPEGVCGLLDVVTLQDDGNVRWSMEARKIVTKRDASSACQALADQSTTLSWQNLRRPLPCRFVQPAGLGR